MTLRTKIQAAKSHTKPINTSKLTTGHFSALQKKRSSCTHQNTDTSFPNQETLMSHTSNPPSQGGTSTIKRNYKLLAYRNTTPNTAT